ncbi:MAG TPA: flagellar basal body rod protein FlgB [Rhizomicrobium sp.]|jgi:flagellar basal-body rod protein FlgB|nr:flagellar basal body rod protein FlgB [Rhizomicrobium sp.]
MALNLSDMPLLAMLKQRMSWLSARQNVLAQNVANVDTPGYTARDLKPVNFEDILKGTTTPSQFSGGMSVTDPRHISLSPQGSAEFTDFNAPDAEANPSGNTVSLEQEMIRVSDTQAEYQAASNLYAKAVNMMKTAIGHGG